MPAILTNENLIHTEGGEMFSSKDGKTVDSIMFFFKNGEEEINVILTKESIELIIKSSF